jgi:hypothetical protein
VPVGTAFRILVPVEAAGAPGATGDPHDPSEADELTSFAIPARSDA